MELLLISDSKLKIMLSRYDMESYGLSAESLDYAVKNTRRTFDEIFEFAKRKTGFEIKKGRLFVQAYPSVDGGCEIYLTRLEDGISGLVEDGSAYTYALAVFNCEEDALKSAKIIKSNSSIEATDIYLDIYTDTYLVTAKFKKNISEHSLVYIKSCFFELNSKEIAILKREGFSKERYKNIMTL